MRFPFFILIDKLSDFISASSLSCDLSDENWDNRVETVCLFSFFSFFNTKMVERKSGDCFPIISIIGSELICAGVYVSSKKLRVKRRFFKRA